MQGQGSCCRVGRSLELDRDLLAAACCRRAGDMKPALPHTPAVHRSLARPHSCPASHPPGPQLQRTCRDCDTEQLLAWGPVPVAAALIESSMQPVFGDAVGGPLGGDEAAPFEDAPLHEPLHDDEPPPYHSVVLQSTVVRWGPPGDQQRRLASRRSRPAADARPSDEPTCLWSHALPCTLHLSAQEPPSTSGRQEGSGTYGVRPAAAAAGCARPPHGSAGTAARLPAAASSPAPFSPAAIAGARKLRV